MADSSRGVADVPAERALPVSETRYHALFEFLPDGIVIADRQGRYIDANAKFCQMLGYSHDDLVGMTAADIVVPAEVSHIAPAIASIIRTSQYQREWEFRRKDGTTFCAEVIATKTPDGDLMAIIRDLTPRNQVNDALRTSEARTQFALRNAGVGIWDMDYTTGVLDWSDVMEAQYGLAPGSFGKTFESFIACIHPDDRDAVLASIDRAMKCGADFSVLHRTTGQPPRWLSGTGRFLRDDGGKAVRAVGISQDVTARHLLESQFQHAQKMEAIGRLASGVAHDFNNLLTVILGFSELLLAGLEPGDGQFELTEIQRAGMRAAGMTRQLLAFSRKEIIAPTLLDLNAILVEMRPMLGRLIREDIKVLVGARPGLARVKADRGQVEQVVLNLAINAQDAMPNGGTLTLETANVELDEHYAAAHLDVTPGSYVVLTVTDSGTGMPPSVLEHLFEPFFTTKEVGKGTGLGLASVHGMVTRSGGSVSAYSEVGHGSSFKVYWPRAVAADASTDTPATAAVAHGTETVLVVEDADALRELTKRLLERQGYTVIVAGNASDALRLFEENPAIKVLLTDVVMPGPSGPELSRQLAERRPGFEVIYMSGYTDEAIVHHGVLKPGIAFLHKPFTSTTLGRKIREVLDK